MATSNPYPTDSTIWLTGLPAAGKSTLAFALAARLGTQGVPPASSTETCCAGVVQRARAVRGPARVLDGDVLRGGLNADLGFSREDRLENVRRVGEVARLFAEAGLVAVVAVISPHAVARMHAREIHEAASLPFVEVWLTTPLAECERRDPERLYARGRRGEAEGVTGLDAPYEPPTAPELDG